MKIENVKGIPESIESFLDRKYCSSYNTRRYFELFKNFNNIQTDLLYRDNEVLVEAFVYELVAGKCMVHNRITHIDSENIDAFTDYLFKREPQINEIIFTEMHSVHSRPECVCYSQLTDVCVNLPHTVEEYFSMLGSKSNRQFRYYTKKIQNDIEGIQVKINEAVNADNVDLIDAFVELKNRRFVHLKKKNSFENEVVKRNREYALKYGKISYIKHHDKLIGGLLGYQIQDAYFIIVVAFDIDYAKYSVGRTIIYQSILEAIEQGCTKYHFLWGGGADYKYHYGGEEVTLYRNHIFRSRNVHYLVCKFKMNFKLRWMELKKAKFVQRVKPLYHAVRYSVK